MYSILLITLSAACLALAASGDKFETDIIKTDGGDLKITFIGHGTLMFHYKDMVIHVDPFSRVADYAQLPKADLVLITHEHGDHLDQEALAQVRTPNTTVVLTEICAKQVEGGVVMRNGDTQVIDGLPIEAVPAYNIRHERAKGMPFHPPGHGNGYVIAFGDVRVYVAGDTEDIPEMAALEGIDYAFLPMNLPYTMTPEMVADAARSFQPKVVYPYHFGSTETSKLVTLLQDEPGIEVRIRNLA